MESDVKKSWQLTKAQYAKTEVRVRQAALSYPEKVKQVVIMQQRMVPICSARGKKIVPWKI